MEKDDLDMYEEREPPEEQRKLYFIIMLVMITTLAAYVVVGVGAAVLWGFVCIVVVGLWEIIPKKK